jgi:hypothetical protein
LNRQQEEDIHHGNEAWLGQEPYLCLYHVIMEVDVKEAYSKAFNVMSGAELDARSSSGSPRGFYELGASNQRRRGNGKGHQADNKDLNEDSDVQLQEDAWRNVLGTSKLH